MLDIKEQKMAQENVRQEERGFTEVSGLEVHLHVGKADGGGASSAFPAACSRTATYLAPQTRVQEAQVASCQLSVPCLRRNGWTLGNVLAVSYPIPC